MDEPQEQVSFPLRHAYTPAMLATMALAMASMPSTGKGYRRSHKPPEPRALRRKRKISKESRRKNRRK